MAWKRRSTSISASVDVDLDLDEFDTGQLLQALVDAKAISESEAEAISKRSSLDSSLPFSGEDELSIASQYIRRGNREEALIHLERFLGRDWIGALH